MTVTQGSEGEKRYSVETTGRIIEKETHIRKTTFELRSN